MHCLHIISVLQLYTASCLTFNIYQEPLYALFTYNICTAIIYSLMFNIRYIPGTHMQCLNNNSTAVLYSHILNNKYIYTRNPSMHFCIITVLQNLGGMKTELCLYAAQKLQYSYFVNNDVVVSEPKTKTGYRHETQYRTQGNFVGINTFLKFYFIWLILYFLFIFYFLM